MTRDYLNTPGHPLGHIISKIKYTFGMWRLEFLII